jgi:hypothetical protein
MSVLKEINKRLNDLSPEKQGEVLDFISFLQQNIKPNLHSSSKSQKATRIRLALEKVIELNPFKDITDPVEWQRQIRNDKPLTGRMA